MAGRCEEWLPVLELILTAPVVVASWISLQYYGSTVAPEIYGGGNKLLHNVVGGIGVLEGNGGPMRTGLPLQSVHDGETFRHEPLRLTVGVEAPVEAITAILAKHAGVRALFDQRWLHLFAMDAEGKLSQRYIGDLAGKPRDRARPTARPSSRREERERRFQAALSALARENPSSSQPVMPPAMIFTGRPSFASRKAPRAAPLQCGPAQ